MLALQRRKAFTLIELLVVIAIIALLLSILLPSLRLAKEIGQRVVCTSNLRSLCSAWRLYADDNDGKVVCSTYRDADGKWGWVGETSGDLSEDIQLKGIQDGKLYPYCGDVDVYKCPTAAPDQKRSYAISAQWHNAYECNGTNYFGQTKKQNLHKLSEITNPGGKFTIVDNIARNADAYWAVQYSVPEWWNIPNWRHNDGTANAFADGHAEATKWNNKKLTVDAAIASYDAAVKSGDMLAKVLPAWNAGQNQNEDLKWVQRSVWGKLGY